MEAGNNLGKERKVRNIVAALDQHGGANKKDQNREWPVLMFFMKKHHLPWQES